LLEVTGTPPGGLASTVGVHLDGAGKRVPGSDYVATISIANLVQTPRSAAHSHAVMQRARTVDAVLGSGKLRLALGKVIAAHARRS
jgi:hypothetical protein